MLYLPPVFPFYYPHIFLAFIFFSFLSSSSFHIFLLVFLPLPSSFLFITLVSSLFYFVLSFLISSHSLSSHFIFLLLSSNPFSSFFFLANPSPLPLYPNPSFVSFHFLFYPLPSFFLLLSIYWPSIYSNLGLLTFCFTSFFSFDFSSFLVVLYSPLLVFP